MKNKKEYIIIIEDDKKIQDLITLTLANFPHIKRSFDKGNDGFEFIKKHLKQIKIIFLDIKLPDISGFKILEKIRKNLNSHVPIVIISAYVSKLEIEKGLSLGANHYMVKPFNLKNIILLCEKYLNKGK